MDEAPPATPPPAKKPVRNKWEGEDQDDDDDGPVVRSALSFRTLLVFTA